VAAVVVVMFGTTFTVIERDFVAATPSASVTLTVKVSLTAEEPTVPLMTPDKGLRLNPAGSVPEVTVQDANGDVPPKVPSVWAYPV
jgi:hypothetical protein